MTERKKMNLYEDVRKMAGDDTMMLFGMTGTMKTTFCIKIIDDAVKEGKKVLMIDTERNLLKAPDGVDYKYIADFDKVYRFVRSMKAGYELIVLDSIGAPVLGIFAQMDARERGTALLKAEGIGYLLKRYTHDNNALVIVTNQPESMYMKPMNHVCRWFGDKLGYFFKEIVCTELLSTNKDKTVCAIKTFRSRRHGRGHRLYKLSITDAGTEVEKVM